MNYKKWEDLNFHVQAQLKNKLHILLNGNIVTIDNVNYWLIHKEIDSTQEVFMFGVDEN